MLGHSIIAAFTVIIAFLTTVLVYDAIQRHHESMTPNNALQPTATAPSVSTNK